jgi:hypothetical protein
MSEKAGEIYYDIEADVSGLLKAQGKANKSLDSIGNSATNAAKKMDELQTNNNHPQKNAGKDIDTLVLREGLYHFHFAPKNNKNPKGRSNYLIFADVSKDTFTIVAIVPHSVFDHNSEDAQRFFDIRRRYLERDIPNGQTYMLNPVMTTGHTLEIFAYAIHCENTINVLDPKLNESDFISQLYADGVLQYPSLEQPKKSDLIWFFYDLKLGILEKKKGHFLG